MKSIRISNEVYDLALQVAAVQSRSLAQQVEHWVRLAAAVEAAGVTVEQVQRILGGDLRERERAMMRLGLATQDSMLLVPRATARGAKVSFPSGAALDAR